MKFVLPGANVKVLGKAIQALGKIGDEIYIVADRNCFSLQAFSVAATSYAHFSFTGTFFTLFDASNESYRGKMSMKSAILPFRSVNAFEKTVEQCTVELANGCDDVLFTLRFKKGITKTYCLPSVEYESLIFSFDRDDCSYRISGPSKLFTDVLVNFPVSVREVTLRLAGNKLDVFTHVNDKSDFSKTVHTLVSVDRNELDNFSVPAEEGTPEVTFCLKEFRAMQAFAEMSCLNVHLYFDKAGKPMICTYDGVQGMEVVFVIATLSDSSQAITTEVLTKCRASSSVAKQTSRHPRPFVRPREVHPSSVGVNAALQEENEEEPELLDVLHPLPPAKKFKAIFWGIGTDSPDAYTSQLPENDKVLAECSDDELD